MITTMAKATVAVCAFLTLFVAGSWAQRVDIDVMDPEVYCKGRSDIELFRRQRDLVEEEARSYCGTYYRCVPSGGGRKRISQMKCPFTLYFDVESQTCDGRLKVNNCAVWQKHQKPLPKWPLDVDEVGICEPGNIECGSGECVDKALFCDHVEDCADGSDENICNNPEKDPNGAAKCNPRTCIWEEGCFCSVDGTRIPGDLLPNQTPQMITITFSGSVSEESFNVYREIFGPGAKNKGNDCSVKGTFFVSHAFTNYSAVQELHRLGHEIAVGSITNNPDKKYWSSLSAVEYEAEFDEGRLIAEEFANITEGDIMGMRLPVGRIGGNEQFRMMEERGFLYDSSIAAHRGPVPLWPYILEHRMPHKCIGTDQNCPTRSFPVWEMVMNELDRRDDHMFSEDLTGCYSIDQCSNIIEPKQLRSFLDYNLMHHYATNRAPLGLHFSSSYFLTRKPLLREFAKWVADVGSRGDFYFVTMMQAIHWMQTPTEVSALNTFAEWKDRCDPKGLPYCSLPNPCESKSPRHPMLRNEQSMYLYTCKECPRAYPWLYDPYGNGLDDFGVLKK